MKNLIFISFALLIFSEYSLAQKFALRIDSIAARHGLVGGAILIFSDSAILNEHYFGVSDVQRKIKVGDITKFRVASISKTITALAVMQLAEKGLLSLDQGISEILGFRVSNPYHPSAEITPWMLLSHTSSLLDGLTYDAFLDSTVRNIQPPGLDEKLKQEGRFYDNSQFHDRTPGSYFKYSNLNYVILGTLVEKVSGMRFDEYCRKNIFLPLQLGASFNVNDFKDIDEVAVLYRKENEMWKPQTDYYQGQRPLSLIYQEYRPGTNAGKLAPQGGLRCSALDLAKLFMCLVNRFNCRAKIIDNSGVASMFAENWRHNGDNGDDYHGLFQSWGLGIQRITSTSGKDVVLPGSSLMVGHSGEAYGLLSDVFYDPIRKIGFVFITNGVGNNSQSFGQSAFYDVEQDVFNAIEEFVSEKPD